MGIREFLLSGETEGGRRFYRKMLKWLDSPSRLKYDDPEMLLRGSGIQPGQTVLEIGCGSGFFSIPASRMLGSEGKLYSTDINSVAVEETQRKVDELNIKNVIVKKDDAMNSSFEDSMFDLVLLYGVVPAPVISMKEISKEICRVLRPGGVLAIWTKVPLWSPRDAIRHASFEELDKLNGVFRLRKI
ncbi:class I SAM-dependent methyltransferase [Clostridium sp. DJ247]|uniref:class I SAM-dependent methyltransferase n=1 Tax=Clostridium sp. DJ247 TaxID=2726188 RepID=UPI00162739A8|nr:class I SAM-dependent methyltransferase [Clostridium sp. DJ247]MBC2580398.1 methyltransferase domain-containing protein [Clostridium sp. DJ247]